MAWPPNPNKKSTIETNQSPTELPPPPAGQEWRMLEKTLMASIEEQRRTRRWGIFFKLLMFAYVLLMVVAFGRGCSSIGQSSRATMGSTTPHLAVVDVDGVIASGMPANADDINTALEDAFSDPNSEAIALNINSPGGSPVQSDEIWQQIMDLKVDYPDKKVYAVIGDLGASGAYYIASSADEIWVNPSSLVGSIGVIMSSYNIEKLLDKVGVEDRTITSGKYKDILNMSRPMREDERVHIQGVLDSTHQNFIDAVMKGRGDKLNNPEDNQLFSGLFWTGSQSIELGLADKIGGITQLKRELELDNAVNYTPTDPMRELFNLFGLSVGKGVDCHFE